MSLAALTACRPVEVVRYLQLSFFDKELGLNKRLDALQAMVEMAVLGEKISLNMRASNFENLNTAQRIEMTGYVFLLTVYIIMSLVLLLNLLIAMMGDTYAGILEQAVREWRVSNAQLVRGC